MTSYMWVIETKFISLIVFEIFKEKDYGNPCNFEFDLSRSSKVKGHGKKWKLICGFLYACNTNQVSISHSFQDIQQKCSYLGVWTLTPVGESTSLIRVQLNRHLVLSRCYICAKNQIPELKIDWDNRTTHTQTDTQTDTQTHRLDRLLYSCPLKEGATIIIFLTVSQTVKSA